eukprot:Plantae.Rhodophyta-Rhodochaete_pulchella.ctg15038.p1 GENE.Plantae.Rhodophyta-Rhodochaete_pulchella.ctg15038~~Plantae.Rhodophyta-Rhodochaete_pulchella.ctg15038.p1  ORF type:complete len:783 (-),score=113.47 Plantae.Rhodophyta-Rhodochaete_pulchella.ctg15038:2726-5074(-)
MEREPASEREPTTWTTDHAQFELENGEEVIGLHSQRTTFTRLECISSSEITRLLRRLHIMLCCCLIWGLLDFIFSVTIWRVERDPLSLNSDLILFSLKTARIPWQYSEFKNFVRIMLLGYIVTLLVIFCARLRHVPRRDLLHEHLWVLLLLVGTIVYLIPFQRFLRSPGATTASIRAIIDQTQVSAFAAVTYLYIWSNAHSYRILHGRIPTAFYAPKFFMLIFYLALHNLSFFLFRIPNQANLPFLPLLGLLVNLSLYLPFQGLGVMLLSLLEILLLSWIVRDMLVTLRILKIASYTKFRSKQVGFRFFLYHNLVFYVAFWLVSTTEFLTKPDSGAVSLSSLLLLAEYCTVEVTVKLPPSASRGHEMSRSANRVNPLRYRRLEIVSSGKSNPAPSAVCFVMQTSISLFNFAWYVYYYGTKKAEGLKPSEDIFRFRIVKFLKDKATDTTVVVVDGDDRIIVAFRGTASKKNLQTDLKIKQTALTDVCPSEEFDRPLGGCTYDAIMESRTFQHAAVHSGFAEAYTNVAPGVIAAVKSLYDTVKRPIFFTGHSLGGALAVLCCLDVALVSGLGEGDLAVTTFGSPRVGNRKFHDIYNSVVPNTWRIELAPDLVCRLPKAIYVHVGRKVLLSANGDLFLDPNALELNLWSGNASSMVYHRKASYMLALRAWCENHHGEDYVPEFWPWPISADDSRRFSHALSLNTLSSLRSAGQRSSHVEMTIGQEYYTSLLRRLEYIQAIEDNASLAPLQHWIELTLLLRKTEGDPEAGPVGLLDSSRSREAPGA